MAQLLHINTYHSRLKGCVYKFRGVEICDLLLGELPGLVPGA